MRTSILVLVAASAELAHADTPVATAGRAELPAGVAVGVEVGEPSSLTVRWTASGGRIGIGAAVGTGTLAGVGLAARAEASYAMALHGGRTLVVPLRLGLGVRHYRHGYEPASTDELDDTHTGVLAMLAVGVAWRSGVELYVEGASGYDLHRSASCNLMSGADSLCPHAQTSPVFVQAMLGVRWQLTRR